MKKEFTLTLDLDVEDDVDVARTKDVLAGRYARCPVCRTRVPLTEAATHCDADDVEYHITHPQRAVHNEHHAGEGRKTALSCYWCA